MLNSFLLQETYLNISKKKFNIRFDKIFIVNELNQIGVLSNASRNGDKSITSTKLFLLSFDQ